jgi:UDP-N-acetylmuramyl pentapeptide phosphotransferase/UDP-N-acetylglucosamine-1-phosphate transferase
MENIFFAESFVIFFFITLFILFFLISFFWQSFFTFFNLNQYKSDQRIHHGEVPRLGGFILYIFFWAIWFLKIIQDTIYFNILLSALPFIILSFREDLYQDISPKIRLAAMIISVITFFIINTMNFPIINVPFLQNLFELYPFNIIFYSFSIIVLMNGMNLIDGMNGLFGFTALFQLLSLCFISYTVNDFLVLKITLFFSMSLIIFLFFNFPFGKIFAGDSGAYLYGFIIGIITISLFGRNENLYTWLAVLILFYPCMELLFSYIRKVVSGKSPFDPDRFHLHSVIQKKLSIKFKSVTKSNYLTTTSLFPNWLIPFVFCIFFIDNILLILMSLIFLIIVYCSAYMLNKN